MGFAPLLFHNAIARPGTKPVSQRHYLCITDQYIFFHIALEWRTIDPFLNSFFTAAPLICKGVANRFHNRCDVFAF